MATFIVSAIMLGTLLLKHKRITTGVVLFTILITIQSFGRFLVSACNEFQIAWMGNVFIYVGGCFCPLMAIVLLLKLCKLKLPNGLIAGLTAYSSIIFLLVLTIGRSDIYYKSFELVHEYGYTYIAKDYGPLHIMYPISMVLYFCIAVFLLVYAFKTYRKVSMHTIIPVVLMILLVISTYIIERALNLHISYTSLVYLIGLMFMLRYINRVNIYDLNTNIANCISNNFNIYIEFDKKYRCVGYNAEAVKIFPEIENKWNIDDEVPTDNSFLYTEIIHWMKFSKKGETKTVCINDRYYDLYVHDLDYGNKKNVGYMLEMADSTTQHKYTATVEHFNHNLRKEVREQTEHIYYIKDMMVLGMAAMVESRDNSTGGHIKRTSKVMKVFAHNLLPYSEELGFDKDFLDKVIRAAPMHDLGKIAVDDAVLRKQGKFTDEEYEKMKKHSAEGARIIHEILWGVEKDSFVKIAENVDHYHHERWDGSGYPDGLKGNEIPVEARLMALADVFDALVSKRCYKEAFSYDRAFNIIEEGLGTHFDAELGKRFLACRPQLEMLYDDWKSKGEN